jgi:imidazolonepropionase
MARLLLVNARLATMRNGRYSLVDNGAMEVEDGRIVWVGPTGKLGPARDRWLSGMRGGEKRFVAARDEVVVDADGALVTPGLIDCHTHLVYAGHRALDFEMRLKGASYEEIARSGGGILSTVKATRKAGGEELRAQSAARLDALMAEGVTTVEIKSGYGLDMRNEMKILRVARSLGNGKVRVRTTLLGAHAVPPEYAGRAPEYVDLVCNEMIPRAARDGLAQAVDAFCEPIAFTAPQVKRVFETARAFGLKVKLHADQLSNGGGATLAADSGAISADHLEYTDAAGVAALARAGTTAVLLPGAFYYLRQDKRPPVDSLRRSGVPIAIATDCNPGTSPCTSLLTIANMACTLFRLTPEEALAGITANAARALGMDDVGTLEPGRRADFAIWDLDEPAQLSAQIGGLRPRAVYYEGRIR